MNGPGPELLASALFVPCPPFVDDGRWTRAGLALATWWIFAVGISAWVRGPDRIDEFYWLLSERPS